MSLSRNARRRHRRKRTLFEKQRGLCFWCNKPMQPPRPTIQGEFYPPDIATIEHLESRMNPERGAGREQRWVLAHHYCNWLRNEYERWWRFGTKLTPIEIIRRTKWRTVVEKANNLGSSSRSRLR